MNHEATLDNDFQRHPEAILSYSATKDDVNTADKILRGYLAKVASQRCPWLKFSTF